MTNPGFGSSTAGIGGAALTAIALPQTGLLPHTGSSMSWLLVVSISLLVAIAVSLVTAKLTKS